MVAIAKPLQDLVKDAFRRQGRTGGGGLDPQKAMRALDRNGDGVVSRSELHHILQKLLAARRGGWASGGSVVVGAARPSGLSSATAGGPVGSQWDLDEEQIAEALDLFDVDGDGSIDIDEMANAVLEGSSSRA